MSVNTALEGANDQGSDTQALQSSDDIFAEALGDLEGATQTQDGETTTAETISQSEIEIGGAKFSMPDLEELVTLGKDAKEVKAEATRKFQEAAEMRKSVENSPWAQLERAWTSGDPAARRTIVDFFAKEVGDGGTAQAANLPELDPSTMTDTEAAIFSHFSQVVGSLKAELSSLKAGVTPALEEVKSFVGATKAEKQNIADAVEIKATYGQDVTPDNVAEMRSMGFSDPVKAFGYMKDKLGFAFQKGQQAAIEQKEKTAIAQTPTSEKVRTFDASKMSGDEIAILTARGWVAE